MFFTTKKDIIERFREFCAQELLYEHDRLLLGFLDYKSTKYDIVLRVYSNNVYEIDKQEVLYKLIGDDFEVIPLSDTEHINLEKTFDIFKMTLDEAKNLVSISSRWYQCAYLLSFAAYNKTTKNDDFDSFYDYISNNKVGRLLFKFSFDYCSRIILD